MKRLKKLLWLWAFCLPAASVFAQNRITVSGLVTDVSSGETLIGAGVVSGTDGTVTNNFGFYSLSVPAGTTDIRYSHIGYETRTLSFAAVRDTVIHIALRPGTALSEAVVTAQRETGIAATKMSAIELPVNVIKSAPALFGEADVLKTIQLLPGVQGGTEGLSGIYVRGGGADENLFLLDGIPLYNVEHMLGIFSVFQPEAVKKVTLHKGAFPARYGGRVSGIVDVRTKDGNMYEAHGSFGISMISDKLHFEGPVWKGRTSYSVSARGMHTILFTPLLKAAGYDGNYYFYDVDAKLTHRFSERDRLYFNVFHGYDDLYYRNKEDYPYLDFDGKSTESEKLETRWGNTVAALRWNHVVSGKLFGNATVAYNRYRMKIGTDMRYEERMPGEEPDRERFTFDYHSGMRDWVAKMDFDYEPSPSHSVRFGGEYVFHTFIPETLTSYNLEIEGGLVQLDTTFHFINNARQYGHELGFYAEDDIRVGDRLTLNPGLRLAVFSTQGKTYFSPEPRLSARLSFARDWAAKVSYSRMAQYIHRLSTSQVSLPLDLWVPITKDIRPETTDQFSAGLYYNGLPGWEFSLEGYWKNIDNVLEYQDGTSFLFDSGSWENKVEAGRGTARGMELFIEKTAGRTTGWLGYTLAWSDRVFPTINGGLRFPYRYDRRHTVNLVLNHRFNEKFDLSLNWNFASGGVLTLPEEEVVMVTPSGDYIWADYVSTRNNYRLPPSHGLNLGFNFHRKHRRGEGIWNLSIYNAYNRMNPTLVLRSSEAGFTEEWDENEGYIFTTYRYPRLKKITLLPFFPSVGYTRTF